MIESIPKTKVILNSNRENKRITTRITTKVIKVKRSIKNNKNQVFIYMKSLKETILSNKKWLLIILIGVLLLATTIILAIIYSMNKRIENEGRFDEQGFAINTTVDKLSQYLMTSYQVHNSISNKTNSKDSIFIKTKIDIYPINETENKNYFYNKNFTTVIIINSQCYEFEENKTNCQIEKYLDLSIKNNNSLRRNNENIEEIIKKAILPICIIEHSDTNIIFSVTCPTFLQDNLKNNIISAFKSIKPNSSKDNYKNTTSVNLDINKTNEHIDINIYDKRCENLNENQTCETIRNLTTDIYGNLEKSYKYYRYELFKDDKNKYYNSYNSTFEDISSNNDTNLENFKYNLNIFLDLINPYMKREEYNITLVNINNSNNKKKNSNKTLRKLENFVSNILGIKNISYFSKYIFGINLDLSLKNDFGFENSQNTKIISKLIRGERIEELVHDESFSNINVTLEKFISIKKGGKSLAESLLRKINETFLNLKNTLNLNITDLNDILYFNDLSSIFDSSLAFDNLKEISYNIISISNTLYSNILELNRTIENSIKIIKNKLTDNIQSFLINSHDLLDTIVNNIIELSNILSSNYSKISEISAYYMKYEDSSYLETILKAKPIMDKYYINEKSLIDTLLNQLFEDFSKNFLESIKIYQSLLDNLINKLKNKSIKINSSNSKDITNVINNLFNSKAIINQILSNIPLILKNSIGIKSNGYFQSNEKLDSDQNKFNKINEKAINISNILDKNLFIDPVFDNIMEDFKKKYINLLNYIEKSKKEKFPLKNNMIFDSFYIIDLFDKMNEYFRDEKLNILNYIRRENKEYLDLNQKNTESFIEDNKIKLDKKINYIDELLSELNLHNLNLTYNELLTITFNSIDILINYNYNLANQYLSSILNAGTSSRPLTHYTQLCIDKYNKYLNSFSEIKKYIQLNLKKDLLNIYKNVIVNIKSHLENIKTNQVIKKYYTELPFTENHLRKIDVLFERFEKYISDELFNKYYSKKIDNYNEASINNIINVEDKLKTLYNKVKKLAYTSNKNYDYHKLRKECYRYCACRILGICFRRKTHCDYYYDGYTSSYANNHLNLKKINLSEYSIKFDEFFYVINSNISTNQSFYNYTLNLYDSRFNAIIKDTLNKAKKYLKDISDEINYYINDEISNNITILSYNNFQKEIDNKLIFELNYILLQYKNIFNEFISNINLNKDKFKYSIQEYGILAEQYYNVYYQNIFYDYTNSIIEQSKNDLNYTLKYYYNKILSNVNKTYSYILNNMPINEELFNEILVIRNNEIQESYNYFINKIKEKKNKCLENEIQLNIIKVNETDFFKMNLIIEKNNEYTQNQLHLKNEELLKNIKKVKKENNEISIISRIYLENLQNEKYLYESINKEAIVDLQSEIYKEIIKENIEIDIDELIKKIKNNLLESNNYIINNFENEKEKYENILINKIYKELYSKENLEIKIDEIYSNGLIELKSNSKDFIYVYLNEIIDKINYHLSKEATRLNNELTSYSKNYEIIDNTINNLKNLIYNKFNSTIFSINDKFYSNIIQKFYKDYIERYLNDFQYRIKNENFPEYKFINTSINLQNILNDKIKIIVNEYKNLTMSHIKYCYQKNIQQLDILFDFKTIKTTINNKIENIYKNQLLKNLKENAVDYDSTNYDLSKTIMNDINLFINQKINQTQLVIDKMKGDKYNIEENFGNPDFSLVKREEFLEIQKSFNNFSSVYSQLELKEFNKINLESINNNFKIIIENFIPSFGKDYFDRIIKYNEIQKIKILFNNLKYSLNESINYYIHLLSMNTNITLPADLKDKIISLNYIDSLINSLNENEILEVNNKLNKIFDETKDYIVDKFIYFIKVELSIQLVLDNDIKTIIDNLIDNNREILENEYNNIININVKNRFIEQYKQILNEESNKFVNFTEEKKNMIKAHLESLNTIEINEILSDIQIKINNAIKAIDNYYLHFNSFEILEEIKILLNNYCKEEIVPYYKEIKSILDNSTKDIIVLNLDKNENYFKNNYSINFFETKSNNITNNLKDSYFDDMIYYIKHSYGTIDNVYLINLAKEMVNYFYENRIEEVNNDSIIYSERISNINIEETLKLLNNSSLFINDFIKNFNHFTNFETTIKKYINRINEQYIISRNNIKNQNYDEYTNQMLNNKLDELYDYIIDYYIKANSSFYKTKDYIENSINQINNLLEQCIKVTYKGINTEYKDFRKNFKPVKYNITKEKTMELTNHEETIDGLNYIIETKMEPYLIDYEIFFDLKFDEEGNIINPLINGKLINKNRPHKIVIDFYTNYGQSCEIKGRKITIHFNNISLISDFIFDSKSNIIKLNNTIDFDEYNIKSEKYIIREKKISFKVAGIQFTFPETCKKTLDGENEVEVIDSVKNNKIEIYQF